MFGFFFSNLRKGVAKVIDNSQLLYTIGIAVLITGSFIFMAERFVGIANDAQERLINVRIGALQDGFVSFAGEKINDSDYLHTKIQGILKTNETIQKFTIVRQKSVLNEEIGDYTPTYEILASNTKEEVGTNDPSAGFLYTLAVSDPGNSLTMPFVQNGERFFRTARAIMHEGEVVGVVMTTQTLSLADIAIEESVRNSKILLFGIIVLIILLFLRHSKIVDYIDLYKKLKEVDQLKDDFISLASHELRTPLTIIRGYTEFVSGDTELSEKTKSYVTKIENSAKELDALVTDILDVSRIEQRRMSFALEKINPESIIREVVESFIISASEKGLTVSFDTTHITPVQYIQIDPKYLKQNLINLIGNAVKYTLKGEVVVRQYEEKNRVCIRISDTGIGMSEEERVRLFEKFYRVKTQETESIRGTGLGLWITAQMIKQMNGTISVESIKGVGSHFIISFPKVS
jgi:signal transduction histidine kinase